MADMKGWECWNPWHWCVTHFLRWRLSCSSLVLPVSRWRGGCRVDGQVDWHSTAVDRPVHQRHLQGRRSPFAVLRPSHEEADQDHWTLFPRKPCSFPPPHNFILSSALVAPPHTHTGCTHSLTGVDLVFVQSEMLLPPMDYVLSTCHAIPPPTRSRRVCVRGWLLLTCELMGAQACVERN
jgi:hypothetical protein